MGKISRYCLGRMHIVGIRSLTWTFSDLSTECVSCFKFKLLCLIGQTVVGRSRRRFRFENTFRDFALTFVSKLKISKTDEKPADFYRIYFADGKSKTVNIRPFSSILSTRVTFASTRETSCLKMLCLLWTQKTRKH